MFKGGNHSQKKNPAGKTISRNETQTGPYVDVFPSLSSDITTKTYLDKERDRGERERDLKGGGGKLVGKVSRAVTGEEAWGNVSVLRYACILSFFFPQTGAVVQSTRGGYSWIEQVDRPCERHDSLQRLLYVVVDQRGAKEYRREES